MWLIINKLLSCFDAMKRVSSKVPKSIWFLGLFILFRFIYPVDVLSLKGLPDKSYEFETSNISRDNKWSKFNELSEGRFEFHSGKKEEVEAKFIFNFPEKLQLKFYTNPDCKPCAKSPLEDGLSAVKVYKNNDLIAKNYIDYYHPLVVDVDVFNADKITIIVDDAGATSYDGAFLEITKSRFYNSIFGWIVPILLTLMVFFLYSHSYIFLSALSVLIFSLYYYTDSYNIHEPDLNSSIYYLIVSITFAYFNILLKRMCMYFPLALRSVIGVLVFVLFLSLPLLFLLYNINYQVPLTKNICWALFQSNYFESVEYVESIFDGTWIAILVFGVVLLSGLFSIHERCEKKDVNYSLSLFSSVFLITISYVYSKDYSHLNFLKDSWQQYHKELTKFMKVKNERKEKPKDFEAALIHDDETIVLVIGESLNKNHMSLYGYPRNTTPLLNQYLASDTNFFAFDNTWSNNCHTMESLSLALTAANQYNGKDYVESVSIIEVLKEAGYPTKWVTNQRIQGVWDNLVAVLATESDKLYPLNTNIGKENITLNHDGVVVPYVVKELEHDKGALIVVHLMGNHTSYKKRYPKDSFGKFKGRLDESVFGANADDLPENDINHYDNSVLYNDYVVASILDSLKLKKKPSALLYLADHGEDVLNDKQHSRSNFTFDMADIPFIIWMSPEYAERHPEKRNWLKQRKSKVFTNDLLFDTMLGLLPVETDVYEPKFDLSSSQYELNERKALTVHGDKKISHSGNKKFWRKENLKWLRHHFPNAEITCKNSSSQGSLSLMLYDSIRSISVALMEQEGEFKIKDESSNLKVSILEFIQKAKNSGVSHIQVQYPENANLQKVMDMVRELSWSDGEKLRLSFVNEAGLQKEWWLSEKGMLERSDNRKVVYSDKDSLGDEFYCSENLSVEVKDGDLTDIQLDKTLNAILENDIAVAEFVIACHNDFL